MSEVVYLSPPTPVHMAEEWFKVAQDTHFWIKRRFDVLRKISGEHSWEGKKIGEIGCGHGLVQKQLGQNYGVLVDGFDLNAEALRDSVAASHPRYCYNIFDRHPQFSAKYDLLILFDVIEHIEQEKPFLEAALYHLKPGGHLLINVPAFMGLYSQYDIAAGHQRRYTLQTLEQLCASMELKRVTATYWGLPLIPIMLMRNLRVTGQTDPQIVIRRGFKQSGRLANRLLGFLSLWEPLPQRVLGTSLMAIYRKEAKQ